MGNNASLLITYRDNNTQKEYTRIYEIGLFPIHDAAIRDVASSMAYKIVKEECGHDNFKILDYSVTEITK